MRKLLLLIILALPCLPSFAQKAKADGMKLKKKMSVLNDKVFFTFPDSSRNAERTVDIMEASPSEHKETRIVFDQGDKRIIFYAQELFTTGGKDFYEAITKLDSGKLKGTRKLLSKKDDVIALLYTPAVHDTTQKAVLVNSLLVKNDDNSVFQVEAYITPPAYKDIAAYKELSEKVFKTLQKGTRKIDYSARSVKFPIKNTNKKLVLNVPANYVAIEEAKYDFQVFRFYKFKSLSDTEWVSLTMYIGEYPQHFFGGHGLKKEDARIVPGRFLGYGIQWFDFHVPEKSLYLKEQIIPTEIIAERMQVHIAMMSNMPYMIGELSEMVERATLTDK